MNLNEECLLQFLSHGKKTSNGPVPVSAENPIREDGKRRNPFTDRPRIDKPQRPNTLI